MPYVRRMISFDIRIKIDAPQNIRRRIDESAAHLDEARYDETDARVFKCALQRYGILHISHITAELELARVKE